MPLTSVCAIGGGGGGGAPRLRRRRRREAAPLVEEAPVVTAAGREVDYADIRATKVKEKRKRTIDKLCYDTS